MSKNTSNNTTLKYLTNPIYQNSIVNNKENKIKYCKDNFKFYKKRVLSLTKEMFHNKYPSLYLKSVFINYVNLIIDYLITIDKTDIIQNEYSDLVNNIDNSLNITSDNDINELFYNMEYINQKNTDINNTLDNFVIKNTKNHDKEIVLPKKISLNLKTEELKIKGLKYNKNKI